MKSLPLLHHKLLAVLDIDITLLRTLHLPAHQVIDAVVLALCLHNSRGIDGRRGELARVNLDIVPEFLPAHAVARSVLVLVDATLGHIDNGGV